MSLQIVQTQIPAGVIDLGLGNPNPELFPIDALQRAAEERLKQGDRSFLQYGIEQGDGYFRAALAEFLSRNYGSAVQPESIFVTTGSSSGLDLLCTLFAQAGDTIFVEEPTYFLALKIFNDHRLQIVPIPTDDNGIIVEALAEKLTIYKPRLLYTIPVHQNPSGITLSAPRRTQLIELAQRHDFLILADEVYQLLSYGDAPPQAFGTFTHIENVVSIGSFSKILAPGLRLGWIQAHPPVVERLVNSGLLDSGGGLNPFTSAIVRGVIESGDLDRHVHKLIEVYGARLLKMDSLLKTHLPEVTYALPQGGYFFWLRLPDGVDAAEFRKQAKSLNVDVRQGPLFSCDDGLRNFIRICFAYYDEAQIEQGVLRLRQCFDTR